jgi:FKBP-type peptidyl-prolyl cis-trans isomerase
MKKASMRNLVLLAGLFLVLLAACKKDSKVDPYDAQGQYTKDSVIIRDYLTANNLTATLDTTGLFYSIIAPGNGVDSVKYFESKFKALYTGRLTNGTVFDSTGITPREFTPRGVIGAWQIAVTKITKGGKLRLYVPSYFGYGPRALPGIPANSVLIFDMEITDINNNVQ